MGKARQLYTIGGDVNICIHCGNQSGGFSKTLEIKLPYDPIISLLGT